MRRTSQKVAIWIRPASDAQATNSGSEWVWVRAEARGMM